MTTETEEKNIYGFQVNIALNVCPTGFDRIIIV